MAVDRSSHIYKIGEEGRIRDLMRRIGMPESSDFEDRLVVLQWARASQVSHPALLAASEDIVEMEWDRLPGRFVLRPRRGPADDRHLMLHNRGGGHLEDSQGIGRTSVEIIALYESWVQAGEVSRAVIATEVPTDEGPEGNPLCLWSIYCFGARLRLIVGREWRDYSDPGYRRLRIWSADWEEYSVSEPAEPDCRILPSDPLALLATATEIAESIDETFVRIDLLESRRGPLLHDVSPVAPSPLPQDKRLDEMLGRWWERALAAERVRQMEV